MLVELIPRNVTDVVIPNQHVPVLLFLLMTLCLSCSITVEMGTLLRPSKNIGTRIDRMFQQADNRMIRRWPPLDPARGTTALPIHR